MRRSSPALALALALSCARDLEMPSSSPPRVDAVQVVGLEGATAPVPLPVLAGELVAIRGGTFPADAAQVVVRIGGADAEVLDVAAGRVVVRVPALGATGLADLQVQTSVGFRTVAGALRYQGAGQPAGLGTSELSTSVALGFVAPVQPPSATGFPDLAIATGAADSALLVVPSVGVAVTTIPLGLVPGSAAARLVPDGANYRLQVLALARGGEAALGTAVLDSASSSVADRVHARALPTTVSTRECTFPQVMFTNGGTPVAAWLNPAGTQRIATIDMDAVLAASGAQYAPRGGVAHSVPAPIVGWAPWQLDSVVFAAGSELYVYDAAAQTAPAPLAVAVGGVGTPEPVSGLLAAGCTPTEFVYTLAAATSGGTNALAVSYKDGWGDRVALVDLTPGPTAGAVHRGLAGTVATSLALVPEPPYGAPPGWAVLAAGFSTLYRFRPLAGVGGACAQDLVPDAALSLSAEAGLLPTFGGMITTANGTRLLATTPEQDLVTVLPPSLTSAGPVFRLASYGGVGIQPASLGGESFPVAVAEHATSSTNLSGLDTGSALLVVALAGNRGAVALGGSGYGRGAVWIDAGAGAGALAYTGQLPSSGTAAFDRAGAAAVTGFSGGTCPNEDVHVGGTRPVANGSDLVVQGPARAGALGPAGVARYGPAVPPVYTAAERTAGQHDLAVYVPAAGNAACLAGANPDWDPTACPPDATWSLGVAPLDVTLSAGDGTAAVRTLETDLGQCRQASGFPAPASCGADLLCLRASCPPARSLHLARAGVAAPATVALPGRPAGIAADRAGGFLVTLPCAPSTAGSDCFPGEALCAGMQTAAGAADGALLLVPEDGSAAACLAVQPGLAGPVAVTPNGEEAWVTGSAFGAQLLTRLKLVRRTTDGTLDTTTPARRVSAEALGADSGATGSFSAGGVAFTPDGAMGVVTVPGSFQILLYE